MKSFLDVERRFATVPVGVVQQLSAVDVAKGRQEAFRLQAPAVLDALRENARIQSVEASNAIENITASPQRLADIVERRDTPRTRSEEEIAGYRDVLDTIHQSAEAVPFTPNVVLQLHRDLLQFTPSPGGAWKNVDNTVEEELPDGTKRVRFIPLSAFETPNAMGDLHERFEAERQAERVHPLLLTAAYSLDFLVIHPFRDGNGRMSRLLTLLLLLQAGYEVGRYISIERLIEETKETYYESLLASTHGWHDGSHDLRPFTSYFLGLLTAAYRQFEERVEGPHGRGAKAELVRGFVRSHVADTFSVGDLRRGLPGLSDTYMRQILQELKREGVVEPTGRGRGARWRRLRSDF